MTTKKTGKGSVVIDGVKYTTDSFEVDGLAYTVRMLSADEMDDIGEAAEGPDGKFNGRLNTRLLLAKALVEPVVTADSLGKRPWPEYNTILRHFNRLHTVDEENPTPPAGSAGPTSPDGGESSPTT